MVRRRLKAFQSRVGPERLVFITALIPGASTIFAESPLVG